MIVRAYDNRKDVVILEKEKPKKDFRESATSTRNYKPSIDSIRGLNNMNTKIPDECYDYLNGEINGETNRPSNRFSNDPIDIDNDIKREKRRIEVTKRQKKAEILNVKLTEKLSKEEEEEKKKVLDLLEKIANK